MTPLHHIGPPRDLPIFEEVAEITGEKPPLLPLEQAEYVVCTGLFDDYETRSLHAEAARDARARPDDDLRKPRHRRACRPRPAVVRRRARRTLRRPRRQGSSWPASRTRSSTRRRSRKRRRCKGALDRNACSPSATDFSPTYAARLRGSTPCSSPRHPSRPAASRRRRGTTGASTRSPIAACWRKPAQRRPPFARSGVVGRGVSRAAIVLMSARQPISRRQILKENRSRPRLIGLVARRAPSRRSPSR